VLVDRIAWQWYLVTAGVPFLGALVGFIAGIVFMARSKIGPALALWATAWLASAVWAAIAWGIVAVVAIDGISGSAEVRQIVPTTTRASSAPAESTPEPSSESAVATAADSGPSSSTPTKACGNLTVSAGSTTCAFAQNVFYEYWTATDGATGHQDAIEAYSPRLARWLQLACDDGDPVVCSTDAGAEVEMPRDALDAYDQEAADIYAAHHTVSR
jgi:hypothetical protein